jgi:hypothetical protein
MQTKIIMKRDAQEGLSIIENGLVTYQGTTYPARHNEAEELKKAGWIIVE